MKVVLPKVQTAEANSGFTLIEIIMVIAVVSMIFIMVVPNVGIIGTTDAASKMSTLAGDIRSVFDLAVLNRKPYRIVFEFGTGKYWLETTDREDVYIEPASEFRGYDEQEIEYRREELEAELEEYRELAGKVVYDQEDETEIQPTSPLVKNFKALEPIEWYKVDDREFRNRSLGPYYLVQDMQTEHHESLVRLEEFQDRARASLYFFPQGYVERAVIHIAGRLGDYQIDQSEIPYTVTTKPYEGLAEVESGYQEVDIFGDSKSKL